MPMSKMIVLSNPLPGEEAEFARWYDEEHIPDMCKVPGVVSGERFTLAMPDGRWRNMVLYDLDAPDLDGVMAEVRRRAGTPLLRPTTSMDREGMYVGLFAPL